MNDYIFFFKKIVDEIYPNDDVERKDIQEIVNVVRPKLEKVSDDDFAVIMTCCFIPDLYKGMGIREKLFTKLTELMVGEWWRRLGGTYNLPTKKSSTEDVEFIYDSFSIVSDAKVFRLGRSQKAPNVKDFLKLASVETWITNLSNLYKAKKINQIILGGFVTYSSLHEWGKYSEVYLECTDSNIPVVMLPYEVMAILLKYKNNYSLKDFMKIWNYHENGVVKSTSKDNYWRYVKPFICNLIGLTISEYEQEINKYHEITMLAVKEYRKIVQDTIDVVICSINKELESLNTIEEIKEYAINAIITRDNKQALDYLKHIDKFRMFKK